MGDRIESRTVRMREEERLLVALARERVLRAAAELRFAQSEETRLLAEIAARYEARGADASVDLDKGEITVLRQLEAKGDT